MRYVIVDSGTGDDLGTIEVDSNSDDEMVLETLCSAGYLDGGSENYEITEGDFFAEAGTRVVRDEDGPVLALEPDDGDDDDDDADDDDDDDEDETGEYDDD